MVEHHVADHQNRAVEKLGKKLTDVDHARASEGSGRTAANGSVTRTRNSIRNSESPKLCSKSPAASMATTQASAAAGKNSCRAFLRILNRSRRSATMNQSQMAKAGSPRSAAICIGTLCK